MAKIFPDAKLQSVTVPCVGLKPTVWLWKVLRFLSWCSLVYCIKYLILIGWNAIATVINFQQQKQSHGQPDHTCQINLWKGAWNISHLPVDTVTKILLPVGIKTNEKSCGPGLIYSQRSVDCKPWHEGDLSVGKTCNINIPVYLI